jgi:hypothetical protein
MLIKEMEMLQFLRQLGAERTLLLGIKSKDRDVFWRKEFENVSRAYYKMTDLLQDSLKTTKTKGS